MTSQPSICQKNPAYIHLATVKSSQANSQNTAHSIDSQQSSSHQEPTYDVINTDGSPQAVSETCNIKCNQTPIYQNLSLPADTSSFSNYNQNPAYGIHSNRN